MRRGEACGLEWEDINLEQGSITVRRSARLLPLSPWLRYIHRYALKQSCQSA
ncbi:hypothetical protein [Ruminococcus sp.]|uniref:hypothetical protein n=1 Tax=Ruminococcus sp. TaxID=41978 RepID=UPI0039A131A2